MAETKARSLGIGILCGTIAVVLVRRTASREEIERGGDDAPATTADPVDPRGPAS